MDEQQTVKQLYQRLAVRVGQERFDLWFRSSTRLLLQGGRLVVETPNRFFHEWLRRNFRPDLEAVCLEVLHRSLTVEFVVNPQLSGPEQTSAAGVPKTGSRLPELSVAASEAETTSKAAATSKTASTKSAQPNISSTTVVHAAEPAASAVPRRKFSSMQTFVVGQSNRLAAASVNMVLGRLGSLTPLFLYGTTGVGKTHLLESVWTAVRKSQPQARVAYRSAEQFTSDFVAAVQGGKGLPSFRHKYRGLSVLLLDDVQFFRGKKATLAELLHTIDALLSAGRQVVLAADRSPGELSELGSELTTRLSAGMVCRLDPPDVETRAGIVRQLAVKQGLALPADVVQWVAGHLTSHAWELAGAVNRLQATSLALGRGVTCSLAEEALGEMVREALRVVRLPDIERAVCASFGLEPDALQSNRRSKQVSHPRMLAMWLARKYTRAAYSEIGQFFGRRSHSTVISAKKKVEGWMNTCGTLDLPDRSLTIEEAVRMVEKNLAVG